MNTLIQFLILRSKWNNIEENQPIPVTLTEIAEILNCSVRNVKYILKSFISNDWIIWIPGMGRGNPSKITFRQSNREIIEEEVKKIMKENKAEKLMVLLQLEELQEKERKYLLDILLYREKNNDTYSKDTLHLPVYRQIHQLSPSLATRRTELHLIRHLYSTLIGIDSERGIAEHWRIESDYKRFTFVLRKGVKFHDDSTLTAEDVRYSLLKLKNTNFSWVVDEIKSIEILHDTKLVIQLFRSNYSFLSWLTLPCTSIIAANYTDRIIGTGPYYLSQHNESIVILKAFSNYFGYRPSTDEIKLIIVPVIYKQYFDGQEVQNNNSDVIEKQVVSQIDVGCKYILLHTAALSKEERLSLIQKINIPQMIASLKENRQEVATTLLRGINHSLTDQAFPNCLPSTVSIRTYKGAGNEKDMGWLCKQWEESGVGVNGTLVDYSQLYDGKTDVILTEISGEDSLETTLFSFILNKDSPLQLVLSPKRLKEIREIVGNVIQINDQEKRWEELSHVHNDLIEEGVLVPLFRWNQIVKVPTSFAKLSLNSYGWLNFSELVNEM
ncbi:ABC transporter substrate-binding protein [Sutcliffiella cohnii]|uniref:ABC transporter substrate-binding protein n=1 Tax=Sutcliffiella cohnii TaxID=33932 RepID=UPI002E1FC55B|nr:ABC transporter substrate-binding protein [Sutcliffiella cohnii]